ncbi:hypothetical protein QBC35DRAFT_351878, partial [Podospora australis]
LSRSRSQSVPRKGTATRTTMTPAEKVDRFLHSIAQSPTFNAAEELLAENRSLHQRIAALQRTEQTLLKDIHDLTRNLTSSQQRSELRQQQWEDELRSREKFYEARLKELESSIARKDREIKLLHDHNNSISNHVASGVPNEEVSAWFTTRTAAWRSWIEKHVHRDLNRVQSGLHPLQRRELCEGVKHFARLGDDSKLPDALVHGISGIQASHVLLQGMLSNFILSEVFESPFWILDVLAGDKLELESPSVARQNSMSPIGFRIDLAMWNNSSIAPQRSALLAPPSITNFSNGNQNTGKGLSRLVTSMLPPDSTVKGVLGQEFPPRHQMERLYQFLSNIDEGNTHAQQWRAHLVKALADAGLAAADERTKTQNEPTARLLIEYRTQYAARLKDRFLRGAARFLLQNQDAAGIETLERELIHEFDLALRFACQLWS